VFELFIGQWAASRALTVQQEAAHVTDATAVLGYVDHDREAGQPIIWSAGNAAEKGAGMPQRQMVHERSLAGSGLAENN
jgi:hypothetical protein